MDSIFSIHDMLGISNKTSCKECKYCRMCNNLIYCTKFVTEITEMDDNDICINFEYSIEEDIRQIKKDLDEIKEFLFSE
jgi:hypothetical protein